METSSIGYRWKKESNWGGTYPSWIVETNKKNQGKVIVKKIFGPFVPPFLCTSDPQLVVTRSVTALY